MPAEQNLWLVTGASSGCGRAFATVVAQRGDLVIATARRLDSIKDLESASIKILQLDVTKPPADLAEQATALFDRHPNVLFSNAGFGTMGPIEELLPEEWQANFDTNFFGLIATQRLVLPGIRSYGDRGWILNNTSMGAYFNANLFSCYQSTKHALANMNQVLAEELQPFGTHVMAIEIGLAQTGFFVDNKETNRSAGWMQTKGSSKGDVYAKAKQAKSERFQGHNNKQAPSDPIKIAHRVVDIVRNEGAAKGRGHPVELPLGAEAFSALRAFFQKKLREMDEWEEFGSDVKFDS